MAIEHTDDGRVEVYVGDGDLVWEGRAYKSFVRLALKELPPGQEWKAGEVKRPYPAPPVAENDPLVIFFVNRQTLDALITMLNSLRESAFPAVEG